MSNHKIGTWWKKEQKDAILEWYKTHTFEETCEFSLREFSRVLPKPTRLSWMTHTKARPNWPKVAVDEALQLYQHLDAKRVVRVIEKEYGRSLSVGVLHSWAYKKRRKEMTRDDGQVQ